MSDIATTNLFLLYYNFFKNSQLLEQLQVTWEGIRHSFGIVSQCCYCHELLISMNMRFHGWSRDCLCDLLIHKASISKVNIGKTVNDVSCRATAGFLCLI